MGYDIELTGKNKRKAEKLLYNITKLLNKHHITYSLEGGTLLGLYRENRILPWDNDVDLSVIHSDAQNMDAFLNDVQKHKYRLRCKYFTKDDFVFKKGDLRIVKIRENHFFGLIKGKVCLEIFMKYSDNENVYWRVSDKIMAAPKTIYEAYKSLTFLGHNYSIPEKTDDYLTLKYGDWKTPVKEWDAAKNEKTIIRSKNS
ncbi:MAG: LicD family protein [Gelidibacter sp.]